MQPTICHVLLAGAAMLSLACQVQDQDDTLAGRVGALETELTAARAAIEALTAEVASSTALTEQTAAWARGQAAAASAMAATLDAAEGAGFTKGINYTSREILLGGWRRRLAAQGEGVPGAPPPREARRP